jgi:hypothetical protein
VTLIAEAGGRSRREHHPGATRRPCRIDARRDVIARAIVDALLAAM